MDKSEFVGVKNHDNEIYEALVKDIKFPIERMELRKRMIDYFNEGAFPVFELDDFQEDL